MATMNGSARPAADVTGVFDSGLSDGEGGRAAPRPNPEVLARAKRRTYTGEYKQKVLAEADAARGSGEIGAVLRRHGLYSSHLTKWRQERKAGILEGLAAQKRGPKSKANPLTAENQKLRRDNERLTDRLRKAEIVIDVQKKWLCCWAFRSRKRRRRENGHRRSYADGRSQSRLRGLRFSSFFFL
jgi:transposase-like protein